MGSVGSQSAMAPTGAARSLGRGVRLASQCGGPSGPTETRFWIAWTILWCRRHEENELALELTEALRWWDPDAVGHIAAAWLD